MAEDISQEKLLREIAQMLKRIAKGGDLASIENREEWDTLVESQTAEQRELLHELARFSDLWRYFQEREQKLGPDIVDVIAQLHRLPILQRVSELRTINQKLMERIGGAHDHAQLRQ